MDNSTVNILGREYKIEYRNYDEDKTFERLHIQGYCTGPYVHLIVIGNLKSNPEWDLGDKIKNELATKQLLRHEIVHAFLAESGLDCNSNVIDGAWACNDEMVDWIAIQGPKIYKAWIEAKAI